MTSRFGLEERATWMEESRKNVLGRKEVHDGKTEGEHRQEKLGSGTGSSTRREGLPKLNWRGGVVSRAGLASEPRGS